jgi:predicted metal-dependent hydrolase
MKKQWGSCSPRGNILLNPHLVKAPRECIDYVILHELCHLKEHNHSPEFYRLLNQLMPDWKQIKAKLDGMAELLLNY